MRRSFSAEDISPCDGWIGSFDGMVIALAPEMRLVNPRIEKVGRATAQTRAIPIAAALLTSGTLIPARSARGVRRPGSVKKNVALDLGTDSIRLLRSNH